MFIECCFEYPILSNISFSPKSHNIKNNCKIDLPSVFIYLSLCDLFLLKLFLKFIVRNICNKLWKESRYNSLTSYWMIFLMEDVSIYINKSYSYWVEKIDN